MWEGVCKLMLYPLTHVVGTVSMGALRVSVLGARSPALTAGVPQ